MKKIRVALVHDWLVGERGGEQVLARLCRLFDDADIFTLVYDEKKMGPLIRAHRITQTSVGRYYKATGRFRHLLALFPFAIERLNLDGYDLVFSTSHCVAHGVVTHPNQLHISYIHTPMRYLYDQLPHYLPRRLRFLLEEPARFLSAPLRLWDRRAALRSDVLLANSHFVAERIERVWGRKSTVIYPPVEVDDVILQSRRIEREGFATGQRRRGLIFVGALVPYKRCELAVALAARLGVELIVVGKGSEKKRLEALAPPWVRFVADLTRPQLIELLAKSEAMVYPGEEDFGIAPVEAMAAGLPVLGVGYGGLKETIIGSGPRAGGILCEQASVDALERGYMALLAAQRRGELAPELLRAHAARFGPERFDKEIVALVTNQLDARTGQRSSHRQTALAEQQNKL